MRARRVVELGREDRVGAEESFDAHRRRDVDGGEQALEVGQGHDEHAEHPVGAVDEGEALLLGERDRGDARSGEDLIGGTGDTVGALRDAFAHDDERARGQGREVARATERAVLVDDGGDAGVEHVDVGLEHLGADTGAPGGERPGAQKHEGAHDLAFDGFADARGMRADEGLLPRAQFGGDVALGEGSEPGRDTVDGLRGGGERVDGLAVLRDPGQGPLAQRHLRVATGHVDHLGEGEGVGIEIDDSGHREPFFCVGRTGRSCRGGRVGRVGRTGRCGRGRARRAV